MRNKEGYIYSEARKVNAIDTTGAGDAFMGGFLYKVIESGKGEFTLREIENFAAFANRVAAHCVQRRGAINAMPFIDEIKN